MSQPLLQASCIVETEVVARPVCELTLSWCSTQYTTSCEIYSEPAANFWQTNNRTTISINVLGFTFYGIIKRLLPCDSTERWSCTEQLQILKVQIDPVLLFCNLLRVKKKYHVQFRNNGIWSLIVHSCVYLCVFKSQTTFCVACCKI